MPDTVTMGILKNMLTMDTSSYDAGTRKAAQGADSVKKSVSGLKEQVQAITPQAERMVKALGGDKLLYSANSLTQAVTKLGGAQKLTEAEQAKVNATLTTALAKYKALGQDAPKAMVDLEKATRSTASVTNFLSTKMVALGAFVGTFAAQLAGQAIRGVINLGREAFTSAGDIIDLSNATGLSTKTIQQMKFVAEQTRGSLENFTTAAARLGVSISGGNASVRAALKELGLEWQKVRALNMDQQWATIAEALFRVENAQDRNRLGMALMGRQFLTVAASIGEGYRDIADQAKLSTDAQLKELDRLNDEWAKFKRNMTTTFGAEMGRLVQEWRITKEVRDEAASAIKAGRGLDLPFNLDENSIKEEVQRRIRNLSIEDIQLTAQQSESQKKYAERLREATAELKKLDAAERSEIDAAQRLNAEHEDVIAKIVGFGVSADKAEDVLRIYNGAMKEATKTSKDLAREQSALAKATEQANREWLDTLGKIERDEMQRWHDINKIPDSFTLPDAGIDTEMEGLRALGAILDKKEKDAAAHRQFMNDVGERLMQDERARMDADIAYRRRYLNLFQQSLLNIGQAATSGLFSMFTGLGMGDGRAREAEREYERIRRSGTASAEEISAAFRRMNEEQNGFLERFKGWTGGILREFGRMIDDMLGMWIRELLGGLVSSLARTALGKSIGNWVANALGAGSLVAGAGAAATGGVLASSAVPTALAMSAVPGTAAAAGTATGTAAAAGAGAGIGLGAVAAIGAAFALPFAAAFLGGFFGGGGPPATRQTLVKMGWVEPRTIALQNAALAARATSGLHGALESARGANAERPQVIHYHEHKWNAIDGPSVRRLVRSPEFTDSLSFAVENNDGFVGSRIGRALRP